MAGFLGEVLYFRRSAVNAGLRWRWPSSACWPASLGRYYYLRLIKIAYFDEPAVDAFDKRRWHDGHGDVHVCVSSVLLLVLLFVFGPLGQRLRMVPTPALFLG